MPIPSMPRRAALIAAVVLLLASASAIEAAPLKLTLRLSIPNQTYLVGEPVPIAVTLTNTSWRTQKVRYPLSYEWGLDVLITPVGGTTREYVSPLHAFAREARRPNPASQQLRRRKTLTAQEHIAFDVVRNDFAFQTPGRYAIQVRHPYERGVRSNTATITVVAPIVRDADALEFITAHDLKALLSPHAPRVGASAAQREALRELGDANVCIRGSCSPGFIPLGVTRYGGWARIALRALGGEIEEPITPSFTK